MLAVLTGCQALCLSRFLLRRRKEDVVEDKAIAGARLVEGEVGGWVPDAVLIILRIMAAQERHGTLAVVRVDVFDLFRTFHLAQIQHRIKLKFQKPEVDKNADVDREIAKIVAYTLKTYGLEEVGTVKLSNRVSERSVTLNQAALESHHQE